MSLVNRCYYVHPTNEPIWGELEQFLMEEYRYGSPIGSSSNRDGASWITAFREYVGMRACFQLDRFHMAQEIRFSLKDHPLYRPTRRKLASFDESGGLVGLESAEGMMHALAQRRKNGQIQALIQALIAVIGTQKEVEEPSQAL